jgi:hypothetical protein
MEAHEHSISLAEREADSSRNRLHAESNDTFCDASGADPPGLAICVNGNPGPGIAVNILPNEPAPLLHLGGILKTAPVDAQQAKHFAQTASLSRALNLQRNRTRSHVNYVVFYL